MAQPLVLIFEHHTGSRELQRLSDFFCILGFAEMYDNRNALDHVLDM